MKKLIYVVDSKKNFIKCQKKQHFRYLPCGIYCFDSFLGGQFIAASAVAPRLGTGHRYVH